MARTSVGRTPTVSGGLDELLLVSPALRRGLLAVAFLATVAVRLLADPHMPYHYDPGKNFVYALAAADAFPLLPQWNPYFNLGEYYEYQVGYPYLVGALHAVTGASVVTVGQVVVVLGGSALTLTAYLLVRELTGRRDAAVFASFMAAASSMQVFAYINYYPQILATALVPLVLAYLVRYYRDGDCVHLLATGLLAAAVALTSYIAGIALLAVLGVAVVVQGLRERSARTWLPLPATLGLVALAGSAHWLPIVGRHGLDGVVGHLLSAALNRGGYTFSNVDLTVESAFFTSSLALALTSVALGVILLLRRSREDATGRAVRGGFPAVLTAVMVAVPLALFASAWVHPLLWPDRYLPFLDLGVTVVAAAAVAVGVERARRRWGRRALALPLLMGVLFVLPFASGWQFSSTDIPLNLRSYPEVAELVPPGALVASPGGVQGFWLSAEAGVRVLGGESASLFGPHFDGNGASNRIIDNTTVEGKMEVIRAWGVNYIYLPVNNYYPGRLIHSFTMEALAPFDNETCFEVVYSADDPVDGYVFLLRVREDLTPSYNQPAFDLPITAAAYGLTLFTLAAGLGALAARRWRGFDIVPASYRLPLLLAVGVLAAYALLCALL